jgi:phage terminase large subunit
MAILVMSHVWCAMARHSPEPLRIELPRKLEFLLKPFRYKVCYGGRGGAKSHSIARVLLAKGVSEKTRILCARELQISITDSVHKLLCDLIDELRLGGFYNVTKTGITGANGTEFIFTGMHNNITKLKSMEGVDIVWVEEAEKVSEESWAVLIPTIRKDGSEIWVSFNPADESDPTYKRFVLNPPPDAMVVKINWNDNPWFPEELRKEKDYLYSVDAEAAEHVWGGECRNVSDAQILRGRWRVESFEPQTWWHGPYQGADWGFASDPTAFVRCYIDGRTLYVEHEAYGLGVEIDHLPALFDSIADARKHLTRADNARPETISYVQRAGFNIMPAEKWPGSVEDGVEFLRSFEAVVIHPRCKHTAEEARLYSYKVDRLTGDVQPIILDRHNHCMDAIRYGIGPLIKEQPQSAVFMPARYRR